MIFKVKSDDEFFYKEMKGLKPNTERFTDDWSDKKWKQFRNAIYIEVQHTRHDYLTFRRKITDKSVYKNLAIISWRHDG